MQHKTFWTPMRGAAAFLLLALTLSSGCGGGSDDQASSTGLPTNAVSFTSPPAGSGTAFGSTALDLAASGYVEEEFLVSGTAHRYRIKDALKTAEIVDDQHPYTTRILVRRPILPSAFNGTVVVEWLNVTLGQDVDFIFAASRAHLISQGYAWVGVSAQLVGANALKTANPARYNAINLAASNVDPAGGTLDAASDVLSWDIYAQIATALRTAGPTRPLGGLVPQRVIAAGESQSALRLTSYYNAIHALYPKVFDGFFAYDRIGALRTDLPTKVLSFGSEVSYAAFGAAPPDADNLRVWSVAGASHVGLSEIVNYLDPQVLRNGVLRAPDGTALSITTAIPGCADTPLWSRVPNEDVLNAGLEALVAWITQGKVPPSATPMDVDDQGGLFRDSEGRVSGGIRLAAYDAPISRNLGANAGPGFCFLAGSHVDFTTAELCTRYGSSQNYVARVIAVTRQAERDGFLLTTDANRTIQEARAVAFSCP